MSCIKRKVLYFVISRSLILGPHVNATCPIAQCYCLNGRIVLYGDIAILIPQLTLLTAIKPTYVFSKWSV